MNAVSPLIWISLLLLSCGLLLFLRAQRKVVAEQVLGRLCQDMSNGEVFVAKLSWLRRRLLQAGIELSRSQLLALLLFAMAIALIIFLLAGARMLVFYAVVFAVGMLLLLRWRYHQRVEKMISLLPEFLDHVVRSLKSGRTLGDAMILAIERSQSPLQDALLVCKRGISLGLPLADVFDDFAELHDRRELQMLATSIKVNQRYGGNVSHLVENLIGMIRDQERATSQLRAMTGETRFSAWVLGVMPLLIGSYIFIANPDFFLGLWNHETGRIMVYSAVLLQISGIAVLWRMMGSIR